MKKIAFITLMLVFLAGSAFAAATASTVTDGGDLGGAVGDALVAHLSTNVTLNYKSAGGGLGYSLSTYHSSGTRTFGSSSGDSAIFWIINTGVAAPTAPTGTGSAAFGSWTAI